MTPAFQAPVYSAKRFGNAGHGPNTLDHFEEGMYAVTMRKGSLATGYGAIVLAAVLWGGSIVAQKLALSGFSPVEASVLRDIGGLCILIATWWWQGESLARLTLPDYRTLALLGVGVLGNHLLILIGLKYVSGAVAGVIIGSLPVVTALLSALFIQDVPLRAVWAGSLLSFLGVGVVSVAGFNAAGDQPLLGGVLVFLGVASWALYTIGSRTLMERLPALTVNWTSLFAATALQLPLLWTDQKMLRAGLGSIAPSDWLALAYLVLFATAIAQQAWLFGVKGIGPSRASVLGNLTPVAAVALSAIILKEPVGAAEMIGIVLILCGVWVVHLQTSRFSAS
jgi:drug/metabolite transporter (DMT)-like permease